ncbi:hypothetical protein EAE96_010617 [Botrytis aclada]|nr:hypothetical protein EAE96_010617 [Botrytis aclada]
MSSNRNSRKCDDIPVTGLDKEREPSEKLPKDGTKTLYAVVNIIFGFLSHAPAIQSAFLNTTPAHLEYTVFDSSCIK